MVFHQNTHATILSYIKPPTHSVSRCLFVLNLCTWRKKRGTTPEIQYSFQRTRRVIFESGRDEQCVAYVGTIFNLVQCLYSRKSRTAGSAVVCPRERAAGAVPTGDEQRIGRGETKERPLGPRPAQRHYCTVLPAAPCAPGTCSVCLELVAVRAWTTSAGTAPRHRA